MKFVLFISLIITFYSCSDLSKGEQLKSINNLQQSIDSIATVLIETSFDEVDRYFTDAKIVQSRIKENYDSDTISMQLAINLDKYQSLATKTPYLEKSYLKIVQNTDALKKAMHRLHNDIDKGNGNRADYNTYILDEVKNVQRLREILLKYVSERKYLIENYRSLHDEIYNFSFDLITN